MGENSKIQWCDHTFNPWVGCQAISPGCDNCYAELWAKRSGQAGLWNGERRRTSAANRNQPIKWNSREFFECESCGHRGFGVPWEEFNHSTGGKMDDGHACEKCGSRDIAPVRMRVFCASLADVFDNQVPQEWRDHLWSMIRRTPNLDWLIVTKRIGNTPDMLPKDWGDGYPNVWLLATIVNQQEADRDIPKLLKIPAVVRGLSMEPLLESVDLTDVCRLAPNSTGLSENFNFLTGHKWDFSEIFGGCPPDSDDPPNLPRLNWIICGGESGPKARPMKIEWARQIKNQCQAAGVPFFFKQLGGIRDKRGDMEDFPEDLRVREFPIVERGL